MRFALVHGAFHGAWCWDLLLPELAARGHKAVAVEWPGHGSRRGETGSHEAYRDAVTETLEPDDILVGHSMGAAVATLAADARPDLVGHICYLTGPLPVEGRSLTYQSSSTMTGGSAGLDESETWLDRHMRLTPSGDAMYFDRDGAAACFYNDCSPEMIDWAFSRLIPEPLAPMTESIHLSRFWEADLPRSYIRCLRDRALIPRMADEQIRRLGVDALSIDASHSPFFSRPAELADLLVQAAGTRPTGPLIREG